MKRLLCNVLMFLCSLPLLAQDTGVDIAARSPVLFDDKIYCFDNALSATYLCSAQGIADLASVLTFKTIDAPSGTDPVADSTADTLTLLSGAALFSITGNSSTDTLTFDIAGTASKCARFDSSGEFVAASADCGTVTSVALAAPAEFSVSGSPVTSSGTITVSKANESANFVWAGPTTGAAAAPAFRALVSADIPNNAANTTGNANTATALAANGANCSAGSFPLGVDANGAAESCTALSSSNAGTATALAANGTNCSAGNYPLGVDASGNAEGCTAAGAGTVTSVAMTVPTGFAVSGSPVTTSGTLAVTLSNESANTVLAGPTSGGAATPGFRALVAADIPNGGAHCVANDNGTTDTSVCAGPTGSGDEIDWKVNGFLRLDLTHSGAAPTLEFLGGTETPGAPSNGSAFATLQFRAHDGGSAYDPAGLLNWYMDDNTDGSFDTSFYVVPYVNGAAATGTRFIANDVYVTQKIGIGSTASASAACLAVSSDRIYHDTNCNNTKDSGEEFIDQAGGGTNYQTVQDEGSALTQRATINFTGEFVSCADNSGSSRTDCTMQGHGVVAYNNTTFSHNSSGNFLTPTRNSELFDSDAYHSTSSNTGRVTIPTGLGGMYHCTAWTQTDSNTTGVRSLAIDHYNSSNVRQKSARQQLSANPGNTEMTVGGDFYVAATDYLISSFYQNSGGTRTIDNNTSPSDNGFGCFLVAH